MGMGMGMGMGIGGWDCESFKWMAKCKPPPSSPIPKSLLSTSHVSPQSKSFIHVHHHPLPSLSLLSPQPHHNYNTTNLPIARSFMEREVLGDPQSSSSSSSSGYANPPWVFKGSALYQFHLVKADTARRFIPKQFRLVEAFGYTVGGFFLASYDESPVGAFEELVVLAGLVHSPPAACAWASRVVVSNKEACDHGRREVGLPSQVATFSKINSAAPLASKSNGFLNMMRVGTRHHSEGCVDVLVTEEAGTDAAADLCSIKINENVLFSNLNKWMGPMICVSLPSYSGRTEYNPNLLKYSCDIESRLRMVQPAKVSGPSSPTMSESSSPHACRAGEIAELLADDARSLSISVLLSKPLLALQFSSLKMQVEAPVVVSHFPETSLETS